MNLEVDKYNDSDYLIEREESINGLEKEEKINWEQMYLDEVDKHVNVVLLYNSLLNKIKSYDKELENARKINEEHQKENGLLREKVKELEKQIEYDKTHIFTPMTIDLNYIPKQNIVDKIQERKFELQQEYKDFEDDKILQVLQELL